MFDLSKRQELECGQSMGNESRHSASIGTRSSRTSTLSKRKEKLAIAQLSIDQIARKHEIARRMLLLQNESELLEAQMQKEEAQLSVSICEHAIHEEREQELLDLDREMLENVVQRCTQDTRECTPPKEKGASYSRHDLQYEPEE